MDIATTRPLLTNSSSSCTSPDRPNVFVPCRQEEADGYALSTSVHHSHESDLLIEIPSRAWASWHLRRSASRQLPLGPPRYETLDLPVRW